MITTEHKTSLDYKRTASYKTTADYKTYSIQYMSENHQRRKRVDN